MKNMIEQVTNLERETVKYVPKSYFDRVFYRLASYAALYDDDEGEKEALELEEIKRNAYDHIIEKPVIPDDPIEEATSKKMDLEVCPYCGGTMTLKLVDPSLIGPRGYSGLKYSSRVEDVSYVCPDCGARSPWIGINLSLIDHDKVKEKIADAIDNVIEDRNWEDRNWEEDCE